MSLTHLVHIRPFRTNKQHKLESKSLFSFSSRMESPLRTPAPVAKSLDFDVPAAVLKVAEKAHQEVKDLRYLSSSSLQRVLAELNLSLAECIEVEVFLGRSKAPAPRASTEASILTIAERQRLAAIFPWKDAEERAQRQLARFSDEYARLGPDGAVEQVRKEFILKARAGSLTSLDALVGNYTLFASDPRYASYLLACLLVRVPRDARVALHNWAIASEFPTGMKESYGANIANITCPLFPPVDEMGALNSKILEGQQVCSGGADTIDGAGWLQVQAVGDSWGVETSFFEHKLAALEEQVAALRAQRDRRTPKAAVSTPAPTPKPSRRVRGAGDTEPPAFEIPKQDSILDVIFAPTPAPAKATAPPPSPPTKVASKRQSDFQKV